MRIFSLKFVIPLVAILGFVVALTVSAVDDTTPPGSIANLAVSTTTPLSVGLTWSAPGDDGTTGAAASYDVRYRTTGPIDEINFATSTPAGGEPDPSVAGTVESFAVSGLTPTTTYWFALRSTDDAGNTSAISNVASTTTMPADTTAPIISGVSVSNLTTASARVSWNTNEPASSHVQYGTTTAYGSSTASSTLVMSHSSDLASLLSSIMYHFLVVSTDVFGNTATSGDVTFTTHATSTPSTATSTIQARLRMEPRTINRVRKGKKITAIVRLPRGTTFEGLEVDSILLNGSVKPIDLKLRKKEWNRWGRLRRTLTMKFNSGDILPLTPTSTDQFTFTVTGKVTAGIFTGSDIVRIIPKALKPKPPPERIEKRMEEIEDRLDTAQERLEERKEDIEKRREELQKQLEKKQEELEKAQEELKKRIKKMKERFDD